MTSYSPDPASSVATSLSGPVPTPDEMVRRAAALRPMLVDRQAEVEERTYYAEDVHEELLAAGVYRMLVPKRYGGYELDVPTFARVGIELGRGCVSTGWCALLASSHALLVGSYFDEQAQSEVFADPDFRAPSVTAPVGMAQPVDGGWQLTGKVAYCSGAPYATHYLGQALTPGDRPDGPPGSQLLFIAPRSAWEMIEGSWGDLMGLKGSGSYTLRFTDAHLPAHYVRENAVLLDIDVNDPARVPGQRLHDNPMYGGRAGGAVAITLAAVVVGAGYNALDEYEQLLQTKKSGVAPFGPRRLDPDYQRYFGGAMVRIATAEAALIRAAELHMEHCSRALDGVEFTYADDLLIAGIAREVMVAVWETMQSELFRTAGSSAARHGERIERLFRDLAMVSGHHTISMRDSAFRQIAGARLGVPRDLSGRARPRSGRTESQESA